MNHQRDLKRRQFVTTRAVVTRQFTSATTMKTLAMGLLIATIAVLANACGSSGNDDAAPSSIESTDTGQAPGTSATSGDVPDTSPDGDANDQSVPDGDVRFSTHVLPIIENTCAQCHTGDGPGTPHVRMDTVGDVADNADIISAAVRKGFMPPWPAAGGDVAFIGDFSLSDDQTTAILEWASFRPQVDVARDTVIVPAQGVRGLAEVDAVIEPIGSYDGVQFQPDEYRCLIYDPGFTEETWLQGYEFVPDQTEVVHHAIGYVLPGSQRTFVDQLDAEDDDNGGWSCFGGSGAGEDDIFLGWAPGQGPTELPEGSGLPMNAGDFIVIQIHYHFEVDAPPDASKLLLDIADGGSRLDEVKIVEFIAPAEIPCTTDESGPLCDREAAIDAAEAKYGDEGVQADFALLVCDASPADFAHMTDGIASSSCDLPARESGELISVLGHEHELGKSFKMTLNPGESDELVLLDIPEWRFDWQLNYYPAEPIQISASDTIRIECSWDRSLRDEDLEPAYVVWADGTDDEMCFATINLRTG